MNYRHAFHAGNFADVVKHALLIGLLAHFKSKDAGFAVLDTHAGKGIYELNAEEGQNTGEWRDGIGRLIPPRIAHGAALPDVLTPYINVMRRFGAPQSYPGSPSLIASLLRPQDALICSELHPDDAVALARLFRSNRQVSVHHLDGYRAVKAFLPPRLIGRGLVLIDPPFEKTNEFDRLRAAIFMARRRFPASVVAAWYPIKHRAPVREFQDMLIETGLKKLLTCEFLLNPPTDPTRLNGCGLLVANPHYRFDENGRHILEALAPYLQQEEPPEISIRWLVEA
ncbi:MAG: 23S rRNA (adenine(2030)-N(6))-methyltransferase RlmJ [Acetobacteraceae bacterium]